MTTSTAPYWQCNMPVGCNAFWITEAAAGGFLCRYCHMFLSVWLLQNGGFKKEALTVWFWLTPQLTFTTDATKLLCSCWKYLDVILYCQHFSQFVCRNKIITAPNEENGPRNAKRIARMPVFWILFQVDFYFKEVVPHFGLYAYLLSCQDKINTTLMFIC